ncbi:lysylphosphatidylglycerol synthase transmembrane domain-containing protein [Cellvibrio sp. OA-2007]|uniref:lysylphosphatidylglycerol synthase transmembrane domain-containing protein n=1 Tax=Cellvibrio sp. OA-2007 TaxID=529823 RepID=UPI000A079F47|nr:lysylphosphatidylglycerol synthase transmembrane domain-containing protein [Cellvibrio sp. OA-2007]
MQRAKLFTFLLWLCALALAAWTLAQLPLADITTSITTLSAAQWLVWIGLNCAIILLLSLRWQILLQALAVPINFFRLLIIRQAGQAVSFITPGPQFGGEPLQIYWLYRYGLPLRKALLSLGLDRFFELWVNFSVLLLAVLILLFATGDGGNPTIGDWKNALLPLLLFLGLMLLLAWVLIKQPNWINARLERVAARWQHNYRLSKINQHWQSLGDDLRNTLRTQRMRFTCAIVLSLLGWLGLLGELYLILRFVGIQADLHSFLIILVAMRMALLLPMPGGVGTLEAAVLWSFTTLNLPASAALGVIALMRLRDGIILLVGLGCLRYRSKAGSPLREDDDSLLDESANENNNSH